MKNLIKMLGGMPAIAWLALKFHSWKRNGKASRMSGLCPNLFGADGYWAEHPGGFHFHDQHPSNRLATMKNQSRYPRLAGHEFMPPARLRLQQFGVLS